MIGDVVMLMKRARSSMLKYVPANDWAVVVVMTMLLKFQLSKWIYKEEKHKKKKKKTHIQNHYNKQQPKKKKKHQPINSLWPKSRSAVSNFQPPKASHNPRPTELPLRIYLTCQLTYKYSGVMPISRVISQHNGIARPSPITISTYLQQYTSILAM